MVRWGEFFKNEMHALVNDLPRGCDPVINSQRNECQVCEKGNWNKHPHLIGFDFGSRLKVRKGSLNLLNNWGLMEIHGLSHKKLKTHKYSLHCLKFSKAVTLR